MSVCLFVPKDLANPWTDRVLLNRVAYRSLEGFLTIFLVDGTPPPPPPPQKKIFDETSWGKAASSITNQYKI